MNCNRPSIQGWEAFTYGIVGATARIAAASQTKIMENNANVSVSLYPNPVVKEGTFTVKVDKYDAGSPVQVVIVDVNKKVVGYHKANAAMISVPVKNIASGFYAVTITNGKNTCTKKIIIQ